MTMDTNSSLTSRVAYEEVFADPALYELVVYSFMAVIAIFGNIVTCFIIVKNKKMRTAINCYLLNLAVSNLILLVLMFPLILQYILSFAIDLKCKLSFILLWGMQIVAFLTLLVLSAEKYIDTCHPILFSKLKKSSFSRSIKIILVIWLVGLLIPVPRSLDMVSLTTVINNSTTVVCGFVTEKDWSRVLPITVYYSSLVFICIINVLIGVSLAKSDKTVGNNHNQNSDKTHRAPKVLLILVTVFLLCWAPFVIWKAIMLYNPSQLSDTKIRIKHFLYVFGRFTSYLSLLVNPIIYNIMCKKFRHKFKDTLSKCFTDDSAANFIFSVNSKNEGHSRKMDFTTYKI